MRIFLENMYNRITIFRVFEWSVIKICLIVFGIILGTYFSHFFLEYIRIVWIVFLVLFIFAIYLLFIKKYNSGNEEKGNNNEQQYR